MSRASTLRGKIGLCALSATLAACAPAAMGNGPDVTSEAVYTLSVGDVVTDLYSSDGDSGRANRVKFRLADIDAPETGGVGAPGGAKCEAERELASRPRRRSWE